MSNWIKTQDKKPKCMQRILVKTLVSLPFYNGESDEKNKVEAIYFAEFTCGGNSGGLWTVEREEGRVKVIPTAKVISWLDFEEKDDE